MQPTALRLDVDVTPAKPSAPTWRLYLLVGAMALAALWAPWSYGVGFALPALFVWLGVRTVRGDDKDPYHVSIDDDSVTVRSPFCVARTALVNVRRVIETADYFVLALPSGDVSIPFAALGGERQRLLDALPAHVAREVAPVQPTAKPNGAKVLVLWLALVLLFTAVYFAIMRPR